MHIVKFKYPDTRKVGLALAEGVFPPGERVIVKTERGEELVDVLKTYAFDEHALNLWGISTASLYTVRRKATQADGARVLENRLFALDALDVCRQKVAVHRLPMRLISAYTTLNRERLVFYFTAESRVDFRQLVRDLASHFKTRIELRQIGVRDEVKMLGAVGMCGRVSCCRDFLECFDSVSLNLAKVQGLPPNPAKLSGVCGRLMCCLKFEEPNYSIAELLPEPGEVVSTPDGEGKLVDVNVVLETVTVEFEEGVKKHYHIATIVGKERWQSYLEKLKSFVDDRFKCFTRAGVIGGESDSGAEEPSE